MDQTRTAFGRPGSRRPVYAAALWGIAVATGGGLLTEIGPWYQALKKPWFQPPDWLFGPAWTLIFALAATAAVYAWQGAKVRGEGWVVITLFVINGLLNSTWSLLFFKLKRPDWALLEVALLWLSILVMIFVLRRYSVPAAWFLAPYLAWVSFASILNYAVVQLNAPF